MSDRKSPEQSATLYKVGTKKTGNDGNIWIITENKNGIKRWQLFKKKQNGSIKKTLKKSSIKKTSRKGSIKKTSKKGSKDTSKKKYTIRFCEPSTMPDTTFLSTDFKITEKYYKILTKPPKGLINNKDPSNAYVFGKLFKLDQYVKIGGHVNDIAQTGFVDVTGATKDELKKIANDNEIALRIYENNNYNWDSRDVLKEIQKKISKRILFVGNTVGGDVGAALYAHYDTNKQIDGLIIDNYYFFRLETESDE